MKWWHCVRWPWMWNIILIRCIVMIKLSLVNHGYKIWYFSLHDSNFNKFRWCYYASMILNMKYYSVSINNWYNLSNLGPYNPNIKYWASYASNLFYWNYDIVAWYGPELKIWYLIRLDARHLINWKMRYCSD